MLTALSLQSPVYIVVTISLGLLVKAPHALGIVTASFLFLYYAAFGCTWGMVPWVYQFKVNSGLAHFFAIFNLAFMFVVYFLYLETANRTLEDLEAYFDRDSGNGIIISIRDKVAKSTLRP
ncbi:hypothetical protein SBRCBS47491_000638 [Sporothrix bragantina]|uniref:Major facilitator superfamily (MFS) profile domain-containing protein n=1 Tax=Sporothrix bragantina TaxID=671064 RepID=A0ABP0AS11_9PEZI